jgi:hypothetical protein
MSYNRNQRISHLLYFLLVGVLATNMACEQIYYLNPVKYPANFTFAGQITSNDSIPIPFLSVTFRKPGEADSMTFTCDSLGKYRFVTELELAGPNKLRIRDVDGTNNGGLFAGADTVFYISETEWESKKVIHNFILEQQ